MFEALVNQRPVESVLIEVQIATATAIVHRPADPFNILVGTSKKHQGLVLPGGKIDAQDMILASIERAARACIERELFEEIGQRPKSARLLAATSDTQRDVRFITAGSLMGTLAESAIAGVPLDQIVRGIYGAPDYLFVAEVEPELIICTEELSALCWINCQSSEKIPFGAGHERLVRLYLDSMC